MRDKLYRNELVDARERGVKIRIVREVTKDTAKYLQNCASCATLEGSRPTLA